jgi:hypothetical protein
MATCPVCSLVAEQSFSITAEKCNHSFHVDCAGPNVDQFYDYCPSCSSSTVGVGGSLPPQKVSSEPHTTDGIDYVLHPGSKKQNSVILSGISSGLSSMVNLVMKNKSPQSQGAKVVESPLELLKKRVPIKQIMAKHGYGLDHMLKEGVDIDDFLSNGYKWDDLMSFEYISQEGTTRSLQTFTNGLNLTASHMKLYPDRLPIDKFKKTTGISNAEFNSLLGLYFKDDGPLCCDGIDYQWTAKDCVKFGLTMSDLISFGLQWIEQYQDLMSGLSKGEQAQAEKALGVQIHDLESLRSIAEEEQRQALEALQLERSRRIQQQGERNDVFIEEEPPYIQEEEEIGYEDLAEEHFQPIEEEEQQPTRRSTPPVSTGGGSVLRRKPKVIEVVIPPEVHRTSRTVKNNNFAPVVDHIPASYRRTVKKETGSSSSSLIIYK